MHGLIALHCAETTIERKVSKPWSWAGGSRLILALSLVLWALILWRWL